MNRKIIMTFITASLLSPLVAAVPFNEEYGSIDPHPQYDSSIFIGGGGAVATSPSFNSPECTENCGDATAGTGDTDAGSGESEAPEYISAATVCAATDKYRTNDVRKLASMPSSVPDTAKSVVIRSYVQIYTGSYSTRQSPLTYYYSPTGTAVNFKNQIMEVPIRADRKIDIRCRMGLYSNGRYSSDTRSYIYIIGYR